MEKKENRRQKTEDRKRKAGVRIVVLVLLMVVLCGTVKATEYFTTTEGIPALPVLTDSSVVSSPAQGAMIFSTADGGALLYCESSWGALSGAFGTIGGVTSNASGLMASNDLVFGSDSLDSDGDSDHYSRLLFDKSAGAFRAGYVDSTQWDAANRGDYSFAAGYNTTAQAYGSFVIGRYNVIEGTTGSWVDTEPVFVIGNGTSGTPSNAVTVLKNGDVEVGGTVTANALAGAWDNTSSGYVRIGDVQICWGTANSPSSYSNVVTFPAAFSSPPTVTANTERGDYYASVGASNVGPTTTQVTIYITDNDDSVNTDSTDFHWIAIGPWQ